MLLGILGLGKNSQAAGGTVTSINIMCGAVVCGNYYSIGISTNCVKSGTESVCGSLTCECTDSESVTLPNTGSDSIYISDFTLTTNPGVCDNTWPIESDGTIFGNVFYCSNNVCNYSGSPSGNQGYIHGSVANQCFGSGGNFGVGAAAGYHLTDCFSGYIANGGANVCTPIAQCASILQNSAAGQLYWSVTNGSNVSIAGVGSGLGLSGTANNLAPNTYTLKATGCTDKTATVLAPVLTATAPGGTNVTVTTGSNSMNIQYTNTGPAKTTAHVDGTFCSRSVTGQGITAVFSPPCQTVDLPN